MLQAGVARIDISPFPGVELTGWGYYIERVWKTVHDRLNATALACESNGTAAILIALDMMVIDDTFARRVRERVQSAIGVDPSAVMLSCSHTHNAPAAGGLRGVGECKPEYEAWAADQAATAAIQAWNNRVPARISTATTLVNELTFNRTRANGVVDGTLTAARVDRADSSTLAVLVNFGAHPTVSTELQPWAVSRDVPGEVCDQLEAAFAGATAMYLQGACGDTNFHRHFQTLERCHEPAAELSRVATSLLRAATPSISNTVAASSRTAYLPTRRWTRAEIENDRQEAVRRLEQQDYSRWRETIGRSMTNRPDDMVKRHGGDEAKAVRAMCRFHVEWTDQMLIDFETRPEVLSTEVQALRMGDLYLAANSSEFFSPFALDVRRRANVPALMLACYSNGRIGYLPDEHDILAKSYAGLQSPKYCNQFPFTSESGPAMCTEMVNVINACSSRGD